MSVMVGQQSLNNVYQSILFDNPAKAERMHSDFAIVAMDGLAATKSETGKEAADRLRRQAFDLPVIQARVLEGALTDLGF